MMLLGRRFIATKCIFQNTGGLKVTNISDHLDNATASLTRNKHNTY